MEKHANKYMISGGGTGGHIYPAIAIAHAIREKQPDAEILFVGAEGKMEMQKVPEAGFPIEGLWISGLQRKLTWDNLSFPFKVIASLTKSSKLIRNFKPDVVIGVGGYASGPLLYKAQQKGIPTVIQEQNSYAGLTNKLLAGKAKAICVAYDQMDQFFPAKAIKWTGNPVRKDILDISDKKAKALSHFGLNADQPVILVIGGSLGAHTINQVLINQVETLASARVQVLWQCGKFYYQNLRTELAAKLAKGIHLFEFIKEMDLAYAAADVVISRAGALSISEISVVAKPTIFVPSPNVAEDHQTKNAMALVSKEAALMVADAKASEDLIPQVLSLVNDKVLQEQLINNIKVFAKPNAASDIADEILRLAK
ncbi:undecaprenyldiphospho-muramoylpentapeptide beta-N-acetylglucosaminyltransferase [Penaeicola halotolerans]|uniref:undecaprenyldiphospho-muramoylpentapeptide beta-N-acetylglucosaminyltransferase n=1 Tax=Penaeicola halotolerans TaxID=2793196 RepID=UPI001CF8B17E|nr:undecaprenyldiphospho-muramoylpentapeptide beta-N-acetylglucosaminyltransferase [Penaeicola halotolerans]